MSVSLLPIEKDMLPLLLSWRNEPDIRRWCRQSGLVNEVEQADWFDRISRAADTRMFGILLDTGRDTSRTGYYLVGVCGLTSMSVIHGSAEFSIYVAPDYRRKGHASAALRELLKMAFNEFRLNRVWGETFEGNPALALYEKLGFKKEGELRETYFKEGRFINTTIHSILRSDY